MRLFEPNDINLIDSCYDYGDDEDEEFTVSYPDEWNRVKEYLESKGKINFNLKWLEDYYRDFSEETYSAGWISILDGDEEYNEKVLRHFANWLYRKCK